jgi:hypothetical protein
LKVLLDHCMPRLFERQLEGHEAIHTSRLGWGKLLNGDLLTTAEEAGFEALVTVDRNISFQQSLASRKISIVVIQSRSNDLRTLMPMARLVLVTLADLAPSTVVTVTGE